MKPRIIAVIEGITPENRHEKFRKAISAISKEIGIPATIEQKKHDHVGGEKYPFKAEEEIAVDYVLDRGLLMDTLYSRICATLELPVHKTFSKSIDIEDVYWPETLKKAVSDKARSLLKRKLQFNPANGLFITSKQIDEIIDSIDKFLNRNTKGTARELTIDAASAARILANMGKEIGYDKAQDKPLDQLRYQKKTFPTIKTNFNRYFGPDERQQLQEKVVGAYITGINDDTRNSIRQIIVNGELAGKTNSEISQDLFNKFGSLNKDWRRIVDTETANIFDESYVAEQVSWGDPSEKIYFKRIEYAGGNICEFCAQALSEDVIALYVDSPLADDEISDPVASIAIWNGKSQIGRKRADWWWATGSQHPNCYSDDTEVLTDDGWKLFKDVLPEDKIMSINPETREIDYVHHKGLISYYYDGDMVHFDGLNYDKLVTPQHNCIYKKSSKGIPFSQGKAEDLIGTDVMLPRAVGQWHGYDYPLKEKAKDAGLDPVVYVKLWAWFLSEGSIRKDRNEMQLAQKDPLDIIEDIGKDERFHPHGNVVSIYNKDILKEFYFFRGVYAENKYIPDFIKQSSKEYQKVFIDTFRKGDGTTRTKEATVKEFGIAEENVIRTSSPRMMADLMEMVIKSGLFCSVYKNEQKGKPVTHKNGTYITKTDCYNINITKSKFRHYHKEPVLSKVTGTYSKEIHKVAYSGMVYDVELVKWHFLLTKRNGKLAWSGNCRGHWERYYPEDE